MSGERGRRRRVAPAGTAAGLLLLAAMTACTATPPEQEIATSGAPAPTVSTSGLVGDGSELLPPDGNGPGAVVATDPGPTIAPATPGPPQAPTLAWLDGAMPQPGIVTKANGLTYWHGRHGSERAQIGDGWYRYFGADGSLVGCTSAGACVGVGSDGTIAFLAGAGEPRDVYGADGTYLGRYGSDGAALPGPRPHRDDLEAALEATTVDLADLVDTATARAPFAGGVTGDPHVTTAAGIRATTQIKGEFVARAGDPTHEIQLRFSSMNYRDDVSVVTATAIDTGDDVVVADASGTVRVDGMLLPPIAQFEQRELSGGVMLGRWPNDASGAVTVVVRWPDGGTVMVSARAALGLTVIAHLDPAPGVGGLFGTTAVRGATDLVARDGSSHDVSGAVMSWQVRETERLFRDAADVPLSFSSHRADPGAEALETGQRVCHGHGMVRVADIDACAFDIAVTGDTGFVPGHVALATAAEAPMVAAAFAQYWPALQSPPLVSVPDLPVGGIVDVTLPIDATRTYGFDLDRRAAVTAINETGCAEGQLRPGVEQPAMRVFNAAGRAVSGRWALCGQHATAPLSPGDYAVVIANGARGGSVEVRVDLGIGG